MLPCSRERSQSVHASEHPSFPPLNTPQGVNRGTYLGDPLLPSAGHVLEAAGVLHGDTAGSWQEVPIRLVDDHQIGDFDDTSLHA